MNSQFLKRLNDLFLNKKDFYTMFGGTIAQARIVGLVGDYVILRAKHAGNDMRVHCHFTKVEVLSPPD